MASLRQTHSGASALPHLPLNSALTFGVELEFLIAAIPLEYSDDSLKRHNYRKKQTDPFPDDPRKVSGILDYPHSGFKHDPANISSMGSKIDQEYAAYATCIADSLRSAGVPAAPFYHFPPHVADEVADASGVRQTWEVKRDSSVFARFPETNPSSFYKWQSVELASPVFYSVEAAFEEILKVCLHLTTRYRVLTNRTCGLHIHVGNCSSGFDLPTLKKLMANLWAYEPHIHALHPFERTTGHDGSGFSKPLRCNASHVPNQPEIARFADPSHPTNHEAMAIIHRCQTKEDLIDWLANPAGYNAYKMENLLPVIRNKVQTAEDAAEQLTTSKRTIEFRQHEGTLEPVRIIAWAKLAIAMVDRARWLDPNKALRKVLVALAIEDAHPADAWNRGFREMLVDAGGKEVGDFYTNWFETHKEWVLEQLGKRRRRKEKDAKPQQRRSEEDADKAFKEAVFKLGRHDKKLAKLEAANNCRRLRRRW